MNFIFESKEGIKIRVHVIPNTTIRKETERFEILSDKLIVKIEAPPRKGLANKELIKVLSELLKIPKRNIEILRGETSRDKLLMIYNIDKAEFMNAIRKLKA